MSIEYISNDGDDGTFEDTLDEEKLLILTKNEALYLSDSMTLLMEHTPEAGKICVPARQLAPQAAVPVPIYLIQKIGLAVLETTNPDKENQTAKVEVSIADLFLLRECCQSFMRINSELVGYNLLRKVYTLILEDDLTEQTKWSFIDDLTTGIDLSLISRKESAEKLMNDKKDLDS